MAGDLWLPNGFELPDGSKIRSLQYAGDAWQIFETSGSCNILLALPELARKWCSKGFLNTGLFKQIVFGKKVFSGLFCRRQFVLSPVKNGSQADSKTDALAFAHALRESRKISEDASFHDAIYVEQYSRLLPVWSGSPFVKDEVVLGSWMTGVIVSAGDFKRLSQLAGWMPAEDLAEIIETAGVAVPPADVLARYQPDGERKDKTAAEAAVKTELEKKPQSVSRQEKGEFKLPGRPQIESFFNEHVIDIIFNAEKYRKMGIDFPSSILLYGPPGCGKTFAVEKLVEFIGWPVFSINSNSVGSPYIHATSKKISEVFDKAIEKAPSVVVIDEMESFLSDRKSASSTARYHVEEVAEFLRRIPEAIKNRVLVIAMTNLLEMIDPAILRRGRFDHLIKVDMPSREEVVSLINLLLGKVPKAENLDIAAAADALAGKPLSDTAFVMHEAARLAAKDGKSELDQGCLDAALAGLPRNIGKENSRSVGFIWNKK